MDDKFPLALPVGTVLAGQYIIQKALGQGGFGITYMALDHNNNEKVAVKEFFPDTLATRTNTTVTPYTGERGESFSYGMNCFLQEAETLAEFIGNKNIVKIHSYFEENGTAYFVMDFVEGISFDKYIKDNGGRVSYEDTERILVCVMDALAAVHKKGIIHRDVTPDNIYITKDGTVKLLDFGAARYSLGDKSRSLDVVLKHGFAPKEQYTRHGRQGAYTDVYSLGASFYFAITGKRPPDSIDRLEDDDLVPPSSLGVSIPRDKEDAILKAMSVQPSDRFQSMDSFKNALMGTENTSSNTQSVPEPTTQVQQKIFSTQNSTTEQSPNISNQLQNTVASQSQSNTTDNISYSEPIMPTVAATATAVTATEDKGKKEHKKKKWWLVPVSILAGAAGIIVIGFVILFIVTMVEVFSSDKEAGSDSVAYSIESSTSDESGNGTPSFELPSVEQTTAPSESSETPSKSSSQTVEFGTFDTVAMNNINSWGIMNASDDEEGSYIPGYGLVYYSGTAKGKVIYETDNWLRSINIVPGSDKIFFVEDGIAKYCTKEDGKLAIPAQLSDYTNITTMWVNGYGALVLLDDDALKYVHWSEQGEGTYYLENILNNCVAVSGDNLYYVNSENTGIIEYVKLDSFYNGGSIETLIEMEQTEISYLESEGKYLYWAGYKYRNDYAAWCPIVGRIDTSTGKGKGLYLQHLIDVDGYVSAINVYKNILYFAEYEGDGTYKVCRLDTSKDSYADNKVELYTGNGECYGISIDPYKGIISLYSLVEDNRTQTVTRIDMDKGTLINEYTY